MDVLPWGGMGGISAEDGLYCPLHIRHLDLYVQFLYSPNLHTLFSYDNVGRTSIVDQA